jgi:ClpP class serine protease
MPYARIISKLIKTSWLIQEDWLEKIIVIARRENDLDAFLRDRGSNIALDPKAARDSDFYNAYIRDGVGVITMDGPIFPKANLMTELSGATSLEMMAKDFVAMDSDPSVNKIVLNVDSPGGVVTGIAEMASLIRSSEKSTVAYVSGTGASAAYWLSAATDEIVISPTAAVGSIGVVKAITVRGDAADGDKSYEFVNTASPRKRLKPDSKEGKEAIIEEIDAIAGVFIDSVAEYRQVSSSTVVDKFGKGGVLIGQSAVDVGMADKVDTFENLMLSLINEGGVPMPKLADITAGELKKERPNLYASIVADAAAKVDAVKEEYSSKISALNAEIDSLSTELADKTAATEEVNTRLKALEKKEAIRDAQLTQANLKASADKIASAKLAESDIPEALHGKVRSYISHEACATDGVLDEVAFAAVVDAEIADWTKSLASTESPVQGFGAGDANLTAEEETATEGAVDALLAHLN